MVLILSTLVTTATTPLSWGQTTGIIMVVCNVIAIAIAKLTVQYPSVGPTLPFPQFFGGMGLPGLLAATSLGHILGAGVILGLHGIGKI